MGQILDKGRIVVSVDKYQDKQNGQLQTNQDGSPKMKNKWMAIGEATKWSNDDGTETETRKVYLTPVNVQGAFYEEKTFWDSENPQAQQAPQQQYQQQAPQQPQYLDQNGQPMPPHQVQQGR